MKRILPIAILSTVALAAIGWGVIQQGRISDLQFAQRRVEFLQGENERLRVEVARDESRRAEAANLAERSAVEKAVVQIRGLSFIRPVVYDVVTREGIRDTLRHKLDEQYSEKDFRDIGRGLAALGLTERDYPLRRKYLDLLGEQLAAFYDQHQHKLFMFRDASLENSQNKVILAHELTHALQDQHFGLLNLPLEMKNDDDMALATSALVEGDATLVMNEFMLRSLSWRSLRESFSGVLSQNMGQLKAAPRFLRESLIFPYLRGQEFCTALYSKGGYSAISEAFAHPPVSTSQILHPEKYMAAPREDPIRVEMPAKLLLNEAPLCDNVVGEMGMRVLLAEWTDAATAESAPLGWRGDRYLVYSQGDALVWKSVWADQDHAAGFAAALKRCLQNRYKVASSKFNENAGVTTLRNPRFLSLSFPAPGEVVLIDAGSSRWAEALEHAFSGQKR